MMILLVATGYLVFVYVLLMLAQKLAKMSSKVSSKINTPNPQQVSSGDC